MEMTVKKSRAEAEASALQRPWLLALPLSAFELRLAGQNAVEEALQKSKLHL